MENPIKMDDLGVPLFSERPITNSRKKTTTKKKQLRLLASDRNHDLHPPKLNEFFPLKSDHFERK